MFSGKFCKVGNLRSRQKKIVPMQRFFSAGAALGSFVTLFGSVAYAFESPLNSTNFSQPSLQEVLQGNGDWMPVDTKRCLSHSWRKGDAARFAAQVESELCLAAELGDGVPTSEMKTSIWAQSVGNGTILESDLNLFAVRAEASLPLTASPQADAQVLVLGYQVWSDSIGAPELNFEREFTLLNFEKSFSAPFRIGPVPAVVTAGVRARLDTKVRGALAIANAQTSVTPALTSSGFVQVAVDAQLAKAGAEGEMAFVNENIAAKGMIGLGINTNVQPAVVYYVAEAKGTHKMTALKGAVGLFAELMPNGRRFEREFFSYPGVEAEGEMFNHKVGPTPIFQVRMDYPEN